MTKLDVHFTRREIQVLQGIVNALTYKQIGLAMGISDRTVKTYVSSIRKKCDCQTIAAAVALAVVLDLVSVPIRIEVHYEGD